jgi:hypothetical protein
MSLDRETRRLILEDYRVAVAGTALCLLLGAWHLAFGHPGTGVGFLVVSVSGVLAAYVLRRAMR